MQNLISRQGLYLSINAVILIIALFRVPYLFNRPAAPFYVEDHGSGLMISGIRDHTGASILKPGDIPVKWDTRDIRRPLEIELLAELGEIGQTVKLTFLRQDIESTTLVRLVPYYPSPRNIIVIIFVGLITWIFGIIILIYGPGTLAKTVLHWTLTGLGLSVMLTTGSLDQTSSLVFLTEGLFHIFYSVTIGGFLYFSILFPKPKTKYYPFAGILISVPLILLTAALIRYRFNAIFDISFEDLAIFGHLFDIFHFLIFVCIGGGILLFLVSFRTSGEPDERLQCRWILWGVSIGSFPFLFLNILPQFFGISEFVAEEYTIVFFLVIPFSFTMAIIRYRLLDIDILISRTLVYAILTFFIGSAYFLVLFLIISSIGDSPVVEKYISILIFTLLVTVFFNPLRLRVQRLIDNYLFTAREHYRDAMLKISREMGSAYNTADLCRKLISCLSTYIPAENFAFYTLQDKTLELAAAKMPPFRERLDISAGEIHLLNRESRIFARPGLIPSGYPVKSGAIDRLASELDFGLIIPVIADNEQVYGILAGNPHHKKDHFIEEEVDLLITATTHMRQNVDRLLLQENISLEREEKQRLEAVNKLMSFYVSSVSHELKSPLSAILLHTELLAIERKASRRQQSMRLEIIKGEGGRLQRLIENILDISKIERGARTYHFSAADPNKIVMQALNVMDYQIRLNEVRVSQELSRDLTEITADADALEQALINLIDNAIKYSREENRQIGITSEMLKDSVAIRIRDNGIGINPKEVKKICDRFYRGSDPRVHSIGGAGIGLAIVQHIVTAHHGQLRIESSPEQGSTFSIILPVK